jgi:hypothetical protein
LVAWLYDITTYLRTQRIEKAVEGDIWKGTEEIDVDAEKGCQKMYKRTNNDLQNIHIKLKIE